MQWALYLAHCIGSFCLIEFCKQKSDTKKSNIISAFPFGSKVKLSMKETLKSFNISQIFYLEKDWILWKFRFSKKGTKIWTTFVLALTLHLNIILGTLQNQIIKLGKTVSRRNPVWWGVHVVADHNDLLTQWRPI